MFDEAARIASLSFQTIPTPIKISHILTFKTEAFQNNVILQIKITHVNN